MKLAIGLLWAASMAFAGLEGTVMNGTTGKPQPSVIVILVQPTAEGPQTLATVKSDAEGKFKIDRDVPPGPELLQGIYQTVLYTLVMPPGSPQTGVELKVYDASAKAGIARVSQHMVLIEPGTKSLEISETFLLENDTKTTFQDPVKGSVQFYLPEAADGKVAVTINSPGGAPIQRPAEKTKEKDVYKIPYPVKPGESRFDVAYSLPAADTFAGKVLHGEGVTRLVTPSAVTLDGTGIESLGQEPQTGAHIYNASGEDYRVSITGVGSLRNPQNAAPDEDTGAPQNPEEKPARVYTRMYWVLGMAFAILGLGGVLLYRRSAA